MAKAKPKEKPTDTPLSRTAALARKLLAVPKAEVDKARAREQHRKASSK
jgi:hypothetical protein